MKIVLTCTSRSLEVSTIECGLFLGDDEDLRELCCLAARPLVSGDVVLHGMADFAGRDCALTLDLSSEPALLEVFSKLFSAINLFIYNHTHSYRKTHLVFQQLNIIRSCDKHHNYPKLKFLEKLTYTESLTKMIDQCKSIIINIAITKIKSVLLFWQCSLLYSLRAYRCL